MRSYLVLAGLAGASSALSLPGPGLCTEFKFPIKATSATKAFPKDLNIADLLADPASINDKIASYPVVTTTADFTIAARYCDPVVFNARRSNVLQVLVHGNTYTKDYWYKPATSVAERPGVPHLPSPLDQPIAVDQYSWTKYASEQGFATLSIDLPCNGASSHADPLNECQLPLQAEALNEIISLARSGGLGRAAPRPFSRIVYVGHSYGSLIANGLAQAHPKAVNAYILTGFTGNLTNGGLGAAIIPEYQPAALVDPFRFGDLPFNYLTATNQAGVTQLFYDGQFKSQIASLDYLNRGTLAVGEVLTSAFGQSPAPSFVGPLFVLNGNEDEVMCQADPLAPFSGTPGNCANGFSKDVKNLYPGANPFSFANIPRTGHCLNFHLTSQQSFKAAHDFLKSSGF